MKESPKIRGHLRVYVVNVNTGERRKVVDDKNVITNLHLTTLGELVAQKAAFDPAEQAFHSMWIEASATALPDPAPSDTAAAGVVVKRYVFDRAADVDLDVGGTPGLLQFRATLTASEAVGSTLRAAGIYTRGNNDDPAVATGTRLVTRRSFTSIVKDGATVVDFEWDVQYSGT